MLLSPAVTLLTACLGALTPGSASQGIHYDGQLPTPRQDGGQLTIRPGLRHVLAVHGASTQHKRAVQQQQHVVQNHHQVLQHNPNPTQTKYVQHNSNPTQQQHARPNVQYHQQKISPEHQDLLNRYYRQYLRNAFYNPFQQPQYRQLFVPYNHDVAGQQYFSRSGSLQENLVGEEAPYDPTGHGDPAFSFYQQK